MRTYLRTIIAATALIFTACGGDNGTGDDTDELTVRIAQSNISLSLGASTKVEVFVYDEDDNAVTPPGGITWLSSDPLRVSVDGNGNAQGLLLGGPVTISATAVGQTVTAQIIVRPASVSISPAPESVSLGQMLQLTATARSLAGDAVQAGTPSWSATPSAVATISSTGLLTVLSPGVFTVTATIDGVAGTISSGVPSQYDGGWLGQGTNSLNGPQSVAFDVRFGVVTRFTLADVPANGCASVTRTLALTPNAPVGGADVNGVERFQIATTPPPSFITGVFGSATTVSGNWGTIVLSPVTCPGGGSGGVSVSPSTFTAIKQ